MARRKKEEFRQGGGGVRSGRDSYFRAPDAFAGRRSSKNRKGDLRDSLVKKRVGAISQDQPDAVHRRMGGTQSSRLFASALSAIKTTTDKKKKEPIRLKLPGPSPEDEREEFFKSSTKSRNSGLDDGIRRVTLVNEQPSPEKRGSPRLEGRIILNRDIDDLEKVHGSRGANQQARNKQHVSLSHQLTDKLTPTSPSLRQKILKPAPAASRQQPGPSSVRNKEESKNGSSEESSEEEDTDSETESEMDDEDSDDEDEAMSTTKTVTRTISKEATSRNSSSRTVVKKDTSDRKSSSESDSKDGLDEDDSDMKIGSGEDDLPQKSSKKRSEEDTHRRRLTEKTKNRLASKSMDSRGYSSDRISRTPKLSTSRMRECKELFTSRSRPADRPTKRSRSHSRKEKKRKHSEGPKRKRPKRSRSRDRSRKPKKSKKSKKKSRRRNSSSISRSRDRSRERQDRRDVIKSRDRQARSKSDRSESLRSDSSRVVSKQTKIKDDSSRGSIVGNEKRRGKEKRSVPRSSSGQTSNKNPGNSSLKTSDRPKAPAPLKMTTLGNVCGGATKNRGNVYARLGAKEDSELTAEKDFDGLRCRWDSDDDEQERRDVAELSEWNKCDIENSGWRHEEELLERLSHTCHTRKQKNSKELSPIPKLRRLLKREGIKSPFLKIIEYPGKPVTYTGIIEIDDQIYIRGIRSRIKEASLDCAAKMALDELESRLAQVDGVSPVVLLNFLCRHLEVPGAFFDCEMFGNPPHERYSSSVDCDGKVFTGTGRFRTEREAKDDAARVAIGHIATYFLERVCSSPKVLMNELSHIRKINCPVYEMEMIGMPHKPTFTVRAKWGEQKYSAQSRSTKKEAKTAAAEVAINEFLKTFSCQDDAKSAVPTENQPSPSEEGNPHVGSGASLQQEDSSRASRLEPKRTQRPELQGHDQKVCQELAAMKPSAALECICKAENLKVEIRDVTNSGCLMAKIYCQEWTFICKGSTYAMAQEEARKKLVMAYLKKKYGYEKGNELDNAPQSAPSAESNLRNVTALAGQGQADSKRDETPPRVSSTSGPDAHETCVRTVKIVTSSEDYPTKGSMNAGQMHVDSTQDDESSRSGPHEQPETGMDRGSSDTEHVEMEDDASPLERSRICDVYEEAAPSSSQYYSEHEEMESKEGGDFTQRFVQEESDESPEKCEGGDLYFQNDDEDDEDDGDGERQRNFRKRFEGRLGGRAQSFTGDASQYESGDFQREMHDSPMPVGPNNDRCGSNQWQSPNPSPRGRGFPNQRRNHARQRTPNNYYNMSPYGGGRPWTPEHQFGQGNWNIDHMREGSWPHEPQFSPQNDGGRPWRGGGDMFQKSPRGFARGNFRGGQQWQSEGYHDQRPGNHGMENSPRGFARGNFRGGQQWQNEGCHDQRPGNHGMDYSPRGIGRGNFRGGQQWRNKGYRDQRPGNHEMDDFHFGTPPHPGDRPRWLENQPGFHHPISPQQQGFGRGRPGNQPQDYPSPNREFARPHPHDHGSAANDNFPYNEGHQRQQNVQEARGRGRGRGHRNEPDFRRSSEGRLSQQAPPPILDDLSKPPPQLFRRDQQQNASPSLGEDWREEKQPARSEERALPSASAFGPEHREGKQNLATGVERPQEQQQMEKRKLLETGEPPRLKFPRTREVSVADSMDSGFGEDNRQHFSKEGKKSFDVNLAVQASFSRDGIQNKEKLRFNTKNPAQTTAKDLESPFDVKKLTPVPARPAIARTREAPSSHVKLNSSSQGLQKNKTDASSSTRKKEFRRKPPPYKVEEFSGGAKGDEWTYKKDDLRVRGREYPEMTEEMHDENVRKLRLPEFKEINREFGIPITQHDLVTLTESRWLNDQIIEKYLQMIVKRNNDLQQKPGCPSVITMSTYFYTKLASKGHEAVQNWTKDQDIFSKDIIFIPVHLEEHWALIVVDFRKPGVFFYDSLQDNDNALFSKQCLTKILNYLKTEYQSKKGKPMDQRRYVKEALTQAPQQKNGSDCGIFLCIIADFLSKDQNPTDFSQDDIPYFRQKMMYEIINSKLLD